MYLLELLKEGGPLALLAVAIGALGLVLGVVSAALAASGSRAAVSLGIAALLAATAAAGAGAAGCALGKRQTDRAIASVESGLQQERLRRAGHHDSQSAAQVGLGASLLPLLLGAAGAFAGRLRTQPIRMQGLTDPAPAERAGASLAMPAAALAVAVLGAGSAYLLWRAPLPELRYHFAESDHDAWTLAEALEGVDKNLARGCDELDRALQSYWETSDAAQWPRRFRRQPPAELAAWKATATRCAQDIAAHRLEEPQGTGLAATGWSAERLLASPLLQDEALRAQLLQARPPPPVQPVLEDPMAGGGLGPKGGAPPSDADQGDAATIIARVVRTRTALIRKCYEAALIKAPNLEGKIVVQLSISAKGAVTAVKDVSPTPFPDARARACVLARVKELTFPADVGPVEVNYPFVLQPAR